MAKTPKKPKQRLDLNQLAARIVAETVGEAEKTPDPDAGKDPAAVSRGRKGGAKGGRTRATKLSKEQRSKIARRAAMVRWAGKSDQPIPEAEGR
jgi:hypothetical protein